ncbi:class I SAM-dependent methyltransferase [Puniceicoccus vermicola]|uniref:Class I SAM-dependent methyltransferase n=1 Tax=Puniceicoccus vermicola TaxID=388746 RepID=A0A7X1E3P1_9BACT|nr:class I SAM-dependent methyltransferase [Puniceicoccus vermicola]MBC2601189.1 class I SAM-dependent methyltransferase [Puniceicoccus vermicola]
MRSKEQNIQEKQYKFPYHYIPVISKNSFQQHLHWSWGMRYLGGLRIVQKELESLDYSSLVDIGCGDGRFVNMLSGGSQTRRYLGIDYSERAIGLAKALSTSNAEFISKDILSEESFDEFDVATMIEVAEHIDPLDLPRFFDAVSKMIKPNGYLILTVPHKNKILNEKHYQHFDSDSLSNLLEKKFHVEKFVPFDRNTRRFRIIEMLIGGTGKYYILTNGRMMRAVYNYYERTMLRGRKESDCLRICAVARRK